MQTHLSCSFASLAEDFSYVLQVIKDAALSVRQWAGLALTPSKFKIGARSLRNFTFKFIVPRDQTETVLNLFADDPVSERPSRSGKYTAYTMEMYVHSADEVFAIYQRVAQVPGVISL